MAKTVIGGAFLIILEDIIGLGGFAEFVFGFGVIGVAVGVEFHRQLAIGAFDRLIISFTANT